MVIRKIIWMLLPLLIFSCASSKVSSQDIKGIYIQKDNKRIELHLLKDKTFVLKDNFEPTHLAIKNYKCCDTISYGKWEIEDGFVSLSSPEELGTYYLNANFTESSEKNKDSITLIINNPIEKKKSKDSELYYTVNLSLTDGSTIRKISETNTITIDKVDGVSMIEIEVYPKYDIEIRDISARSVYTIPYQVVNSESNLFNIDIPELDYSYLAYKRLNKDYVRVLNGKKLLWDNIEYVKKL